MSGMRESALMALVAALGPGCYAASLADFTKCISAQGQGSVCQLDAGTYQLNVPFTIGRSNITVRGTINDVCTKPLVVELTGTSIIVT